MAHVLLTFPALSFGIRSKGAPSCRCTVQAVCVQSLSWYSDYKNLSLDFGYRRYVTLNNPNYRVFGEATIGIGFIDAIDVQLAAPQSNVIFSNTDFYDSTAAFTFGVNVGVLFKVTDRTDLTAQVGLRHVSGLSQVDQLVGTGLADLNDNSSRLTFPVVVGVRFHF